MINRTIKDQIIKYLKDWPITLITGSRQIGKSTICLEIAKELNYEYVSLDDIDNRTMAIENPKKFIEQFGDKKLIIDEIQYAPILFDVLTSIVNQIKLFKNDDDAYGRFIITGSQSYHLMKNATESMAGRVNIINMSNLSLNEINGNIDTPPFEVDNELLFKNEKNHKHLFKDELLKVIHRGFYPELYKINIRIDFFYRNYIDSYINKDVRELINIKDMLKFNQFMSILATYSGQELIKTNLSNQLQIDSRTIDSWISILLAGGIISLVQPYYEKSITKRIVKKNKIYFNDTGLLCYLLKIKDAKELKNSKYLGAIFETYIFNEIKKSYLNNLDDSEIYFYRDKEQNEIDFVIIRNNKINLVEVKSGEDYSLKHIKAFDIFYQSDFMINGKCIICTTDNSYPLKNGLFVFPHQVI